MKERLKAPELRFEGFTDDWEERKLGDFIKISREQEVKKVDLHEEKIGYYVLAMRTFDFEGYIDYSKPYWINNFESADDDLFLNRKEFAIIDADMDASLPKIGKVLLNATNNKFLLAAHIRKIKVDVQVDSIFAYALMRTTELVERLKLEANGSISKRLLDKNVYKQKVYLPIHLEEQQQIGEFFWTLEETITLHQRKLDLLKEQKKGFLQKMFPKNGAKVPELRFAGFADDWEQRKLSDVANHRGGTAIEKYFDKDGVYKVISIGSYGLNSQYVDQNIRAISNEITDGRVVNSGELTMVLNDKTANGTIIGRTLLVEKDNEYVINQRTEIISPKENFDSSFAYTILNGPFREKVKRIVQGGTQIYVNYPAVSNLNLELPEIEEQQKIGSFFKQLDDTIALHQRKLDLLKEQKKGFLQKMFV
ncbi:restriction endonuclease subunit S [Lactococcus lactis subsp. lactis]|uniref:restriction endonuclease subunit S n=1 Tax=Lactococcus lactis TaxID=1358 RepID=UPI00265DA8C4|nr:restriction endonuclease subunit S [Lactococcus lactis]QTP11296.2 restriction endonuclease subunit S [Lactococcus lactis subsp. lactis]